MYASMNYLSKRIAPRKSFAKPQCGAVLILAILIVALVAGLSIKFAGDYQLGLARAEGRWHGAQARAYSYSAEGAAIKILASDDASYDSLDEPWAVEIPIEVEGGGLFITITDASAQFNLNSLAGALDPAKSPEDPTRYTPSQRMFVRLLQTFSEDVRSTSEAAAILEAVIDWADADNNPSGSNGAEEDYYLSLPDPYRPANAEFRSLEELQMVRGITPALMRVLRPFVTVMGQEQGKLVNVNTMPLAIYRSVNVDAVLTPLDITQAESLQKELPSAGHYTQLADFQTSFNRIQGASGQLDMANLSVKTDFLWLTTRAQIGDQRRTGRSLLKRDLTLSTFTVVRREDVY